MNTQLPKAFTFGKFLPFHKGHEALIRFSLQHCSQLTVLVCCSNLEQILCSTRTRWIEECFAGEPRVSVRALPYNESDLPNTSVSSAQISAIWSRLFKTLVPDCELVITSEPYGKMVAEVMNIQAVLFDEARIQFPISATLIRNNLFQHWNFLPAPVKQSYAIKIVVLGTESTGKSTLSEQLARYFKASLVSEAGRDLIADSNDFNMHDLHAVAAEHARRIQLAASGDSPLVMVDTDLHITQSYALFEFGEELKVSEEIIMTNKASLYLYLNNDVPFMQDGTRLEESRRNALDQSHRTVLKKYQIEAIEISGNWEERFIQSVKTINLHLKNFFGISSQKL